jgi:hypothetical protein
MFADKGQTYGYLTEDPFATTKNYFSPRYPDRGSGYLAPQSTIPQYGQYALELHPEHRARTTITFDDSLDRTKGNFATADEVLRGGNPYHDSVAEGSMLYELAKHYSQARKDAIEKLGLQKAGMLYGRDEHDLSKVLNEQGLPSKFAQLMERYGLKPLQDGSGTPRFARQVPRVLTELEGSPMMRSELYSLEDIVSLKNKLGLRDPMDYVEAQIHGDVTPEHVRRIYDLNYEPSLSTEKAVKKLGIEYVPRPTDSVYDKAKAMDLKTMGEFYDLQAREGLLPEYMRNQTIEYGPLKGNQEFRRLELLPFKVGFKHGGLAQAKECDCG